MSVSFLMAIADGQNQIQLLMILMATKPVPAKLLISWGGAKKQM
jgi:hypothetical protein